MRRTCLPSICAKIALLGGITVGLATTPVIPGCLAFNEGSTTFWTFPDLGKRALLVLLAFLFTPEEEVMALLKGLNAP